MNAHETSSFSTDNIVTTNNTTTSTTNSPSPTFHPPRTPTYNPTSPGKLPREELGRASPISSHSSPSPTGTPITPGKKLNIFNYTSTSTSDEPMQLDDPLYLLPPSRMSTTGFISVPSFSPFHLPDNNSPQSNHNSPLSNHNSPLSHHNSPLSNHNSPQSNHNSSRSNHNSPLPDQDSPQSDHNSPQPRASSLSPQPIVIESPPPRTDEVVDVDSSSPCVIDLISEDEDEDEVQFVSNVPSVVVSLFLIFFEKL